MTLKEFKEQFRWKCVDLWGDAVEAWFSCAGEMFTRRMKIPEGWNYRPGRCPVDVNSQWHLDMWCCTDTELVIIGNFLFRYCQLLKFHEKDY